MSVEENQFNPQDFVNSLNEVDNSQSQFEVPEEISGIKNEEFLKGLSHITNDRISSFDDLSSMMRGSSELNEYKGKYDELEQKYNASKNPFANDFVKELNQLYRSGDIDQGQINHFIKMQQLDLDSMGPEKLLMLQKSQRYPGMTQDKVEAAFKEEFGDPEDWSEGTRALMEQKAHEARQELSKMKKDSSRPSGLVAREERETQFSNKLNYWRSVEAAVEVPSSLKIQHELSNNSSFDFDFNLPEGALDGLRQARVEYLTNNVNRGDKDAYKKNIGDFTKSYLYAHYGDQILRSALEHAVANASLKKDQEHHNVLPIPQGKDNKPKISDVTKAHLDRIRRQGLEGR
jgi:cell fate (sporulation/competence/biofilm development) regulator YlbF (YheA/YmcA/DUF963 family)